MGGPVSKPIYPGTRFGSWSVIGEADVVQYGRHRHRHRVMICRCGCGTEKPVFLHSLRSGASTSCAHCHLKKARPLITPKTKLAFYEVAQIKIRLAAGERQYLIALDYEVHRSTINFIASGRSWKHVPWPKEGGL